MGSEDAPSPGAMDSTVAPMDRAEVAPTLREFSFPFWLINGIELLERGAYYAATAILGIYLVNQLGLGPVEAGFIFALFLPLFYIVPIIAAPFAEMIGYRRALLISFALYPVGYLLLATFRDFWGIVFATVVVAVAGGIFKPVSAGTIGQLSTTRQRNLAFAVYYWAINIGSFLTPLLIVLFFPPPLYRYVLVLSAGCVALDLVIVATLFRNARPPERQKKVLTEAASILEIFRNPRLLLLLIFWSGLWFMYAVNLSFAPVYLVQYVKLPPSMVGPAPGLFQATNPLVIILLGPLIARVTRKMPTLPLMTGGLVLYIVGVLVMGITTDPWLVFFLGVVIYSIGEFASQPAFYSYVSKMAPPDRAALYMSYSFLPIAIGFTVAPPLVGWLYETVLLGMGAPRLFWAAIASVGLLALACLLLYNVFLARAQARDAAVAVASALATSSGTASVPEAHSAPGTPSAPAVRFPSRRSTLTGGALAVVALLFIPVVLGGALMAGSTAKPVVVAPGSATAYIAPLHGVAQAGQAVAKSVSLPRNATGNATFTLTWNDAAGTTPAAAQGPDDVKLSVASPEGGSFSKETQSPAGQQGSLMVVASQATSEAGGLYNVTITLVSSGSTVNTPLGIPVPGSSGSINWALNVSYTAASGP